MTHEPAGAAPEVVIGDGPVLLAVADGIATLTLDRPASANGMNLELMQALHRAAMACHRHPDLRVVVLRGAGRNFCAGGDVREFAAQGDGIADYMREVTAHLQAAVGVLIRLDAIVVAEVQGFAAGGGGLGLVCASDIVVAGEGAKFLAGATRVAMVPDAGASVILPRLVGFRRAMEILVSNRVVPAAEALAIGLVTKVVPDADLATETMALARTIAAGAPMALANMKRLLWNGLGVETVLPEEARTQSLLCGTDDAAEGLRAVIEKRAPRFTGR